MIFTIAKAEVFKLFKTGKAFKLLALCQLILGLIFYWLMEEFLSKAQSSFLENNDSLGITEEVVHPFFAWSALFFLFLIPLLASNITQERKSQMLVLYLTSPLSKTQIILGKFIGLLQSLWILLLPVLCMPLLITVSGHLDLGQFIAGCFGLMLFLGACLSLGIWIATRAKEPIVAAVLIFVLLILFNLLEWMVRYFPPNLQWLSEFSLLYHCKNFLSGIINTRAIIYYGLFSFICLALSVKGLTHETPS